MQMSNIKCQIIPPGVALENNPSAKELKFGERLTFLKIKLWCRISLSEATKFLELLSKPSERLEQMRLLSKAAGPRKTAGKYGYRLAMLERIMNYELRCKEKEQGLSICKRTERRYGKSWIVEKNLRKVFHLASGFENQVKLKFERAALAACGKLATLTIFYYEI